MSDIPLPGPDLSDEEQTAHDRAAYEAQMQFAWQDALEWAKRGDRRSLVTLLRGEQQLCEREVLDFLADLVEGKFKWPRGKPPQRPEYTFAYTGKPFESPDRFDPRCLKWVDKRDVAVLELRKWIRDNKAAHGHDIYRAAAKKFGMTAKNAENLDRRSMEARKQKRST